ncbi:MAG: hypothetical protein KQI81_08665 [Deltaproteobacteria bacterium]|nr:hypothetical protein [Deltaproteobacteria bacterium]
MPLDIYVNLEVNLGYADAETNFNVEKEEFAKLIKETKGGQDAIYEIGRQLFEDSAGIEDIKDTVIELGATTQTVINLTEWIFDEIRSL